MTSKTQLGARYLSRGPNEGLKKHEFKPGNPGSTGRPVGSRNRLSTAFLFAMAEDFDQHGVEAIEKVRSTDPVAYLRVIASTLPKEIELKRPLADLTDEELSRAIDLIRAALGDAAEGDGEGAGSASAGKPTGVISPLH